MTMSRFGSTGAPPEPPSGSLPPLPAEPPLPAAPPLPPLPPTFVPGLQVPSKHSGFAASLQSPSSTHSTHWNVSGLQIGASSPHCSVFSGVHATQDPCSLQTGVFGSIFAHSSSDLQATQVCAFVSQTGLSPLHSLSALQPTQVFEPVSQVGLSPLHASSLPSVHSTQVFLPVLQAGFLGSLQSSSALQSTQVFEPGSQTPVAQESAWPGIHATHSPLSFWQNGSVGLLVLHSASSVQPTQVRVFVSQIGVPPLQSALVAHSTQVWSFGSQTRAPLSLQSSEVWQPTQVLVLVSQRGLSSVHLPFESASHSPQRPLSRQTGSLGSFPAHSWSVLHVPQTCVVGLQMGVVFGQSADVVQPTHVLVDTSHFLPSVHSLSLVQATQVFDAEQAGLSAGQAVVLVGVQVTHSPVPAQTGAAAFLDLHSASLSHGVQTVASQMGVTPAQSVLVMQLTHVLVVALHALVPGQSFAFKHCTHLFVVVSQTSAPGVLQSLFSVHWTQTFGPSSQAGVAPLQDASLVSVQTTQAPDSSHAGLVGSFVAQAASVVQPLQVCVPRSQSGALGLGQSLSPRQATHWFGLVPVSQSGAEAGHASVEVASQIWTVIVVPWLPGSDCKPSVR